MCTIRKHSTWDLFRDTVENKIRHVGARAIYLLQQAGLKARCENDYARLRFMYWGAPVCGQARTGSEGLRKAVRIGNSVFYVTFRKLYRQLKNRFQRYSGEGRIPGFPPAILSINFPDAPARTFSTGGSRPFWRYRPRGEHSIRPGPSQFSISFLL